MWRQTRHVSRQFEIRHSAIYDPKKFSSGHSPSLKIKRSLSLENKVPLSSGCQFKLQMRWQSKMWQRALEKPHFRRRSFWTLLASGWALNWKCSPLPLLGKTNASRSLFLFLFPFIAAQWIKGIKGDTSGACSLKSWCFSWMWWRALLWGGFEDFSVLLSVWKHWKANLLFDCGYMAFKLLFAQKVHTVCGSWFIFGNLLVSYLEKFK